MLRLIAKWWFWNVTQRRIAHEVKVKLDREFAATGLPFKPGDRVMATPESNIDHGYAPGVVVRVGTHRYFGGDVVYVRYDCGLDGLDGQGFATPRSHLVYER